MKAIKKLLTILLLAAVVITSINLGAVKTEAAGKTKTITTTQECSIWTQPNTSEQYRQKKIPAGHQVTVYTDVVPSTKGDGKTFYKTIKGAYILCRCVDGASTVSVPVTGGSYKTPYSMANVATTPVVIDGKKCNIFTTLYRGAVAYVAITFYAKEESKVTIIGEQNCIIGKGLPVRVWGYTKDGYYICSPNWKGTSYSFYSFIPMSVLTEQAPAQLYDLGKMVTSKTKPSRDPDTGEYNYRKNTMQLSLLPRDCYREYLIRYGMNSYIPGWGKKYFAEIDYKNDLNAIPETKSPINDYVYLVFDGRSYEENVNRLKAVLDEGYEMNPNATAYGLSVNAAEVTKEQFISMQKEVYRYAVEKYGYAKIGIGDFGNYTWSSNPEGGICHFWGMGGKEYYDCVIALKK
ncbi:MAG: hypothetical protein KBS85_00395 [Lachnospiraceae bacterium]|nr:hypothetical protein [Candidatus Merdinaster equi]